MLEKLFSASRDLVVSRSFTIPSRVGVMNSTRPSSGTSFSSMSHMDAFRPLSMSAPSV